MTTRIAQPGEPGPLADLFTDIGRLLGLITQPPPPPAPQQGGLGRTLCLPGREP